MAERFYSLGIDLCSISHTKVRIRNNPLFLIRTFNDPEIIYCEEVPNHEWERFAGIWAAKEAVIKALKGLGPRRPFLDIYALHNQSGDPFIYLEGRAKEKAEQLGATRLLASISHTGDYAIAGCIAFDDRRFEEDMLKKFEKIHESFNSQLKSFAL